MMTKHNFKEFAKAIKAIPNVYWRVGTAKLVADVCQADNDKFDRARFLRACNATEITERRGNYNDCNG